MNGDAIESLGERIMFGVAVSDCYIYWSRLQGRESKKCGRVGKRFELKSFENLLEFELVPANFRSQAREFPVTVNFTVKVLDCGVPVPLILNRLFVRSCITLMCGSQLMVADDLVIGYSFPFGRSDVMLRMYERVSHKTDMTHDPDKFLGWHRIPLVTIDF